MRELSTSTIIKYNVTIFVLTNELIFYADVARGPSTEPARQVERFLRHGTPVLIHLTGGHGRGPHGERVMTARAVEASVATVLLHLRLPRRHALQTVGAIVRVNLHARHVRITVNSEGVLKGQCYELCSDESVKWYVTICLWFTIEWMNKLMNSRV